MWGDSGGSLNESPSEKEGKWSLLARPPMRRVTLNESPSEKEGKCHSMTSMTDLRERPSMKVPPKRKGNLRSQVPVNTIDKLTLNESPSEKEGKSPAISAACATVIPQ